MALTLKEQNNWKIWLFALMNTILFFSVLEANTVQLMGLTALIAHADKALPVGAAGIIATVLNHLISADLKATLVYLRLRHALPGHRAFSIYAHRDTRIDVSRLLKGFKGTFPSDPKSQNASWYKIYRSVRDDPSVRDAHKTFLLLRDFTTLSVFFIASFGLWALIAMPNKLGALGYIAMLLVQYGLSRQGASIAGERMVTNVLALQSAATR